MQGNGNNNVVLVSLDHISYRYHSELVLDDVSLTIHKGEFLGVIGPNGSGKTTLLKILLGLLKPTSGSVSLFGKDIRQFREWFRLGYVPQKAGILNVHFPITVEEVVQMGTKDIKNVSEALHAVDMEIHRKKLITDLSGGQQQRVFIARALANKPELLILDEPTTGVDIESQAKFYQLLHTINKELHVTLVLVSHDIDVVAHEVSEIACLNNRLVCHGKPKDILNSNFMDQLYGKELRFVVHGH